MVGEGYALAREEQVRTLTAYSGITTGDGTSGGTSLVCSDISGETYLTRHNKSILIMSGDAQYETVGIASVSGEVVTFTEALSQQIVAGVSFRVLNTLPGSLHITSGQVQIMGWDYESGEWRNVRVTGSGEMAIHITVTDIVTAKISGQSVVVTSGEVQLQGWDYESGEPRKVRVTGSGELAIHVTVADIVTAKISGETVYLASGTGPILARISGDVVKISGETVELQSGTGPILAKVSGETITAKVSGETVSIETPTMVKTGPIRQLTDLSGGQVLHSGAIKSALVKALTANSGVIAVGGSGDRPWYEAACSGQGLVLDGGEAVSLDVDDFSRVYVVAEVSGEQVSFIGVN